MDEMLIVIGMALVTYATRYTMIAALGWRTSLLDGGEGSSVLERWLRYVPPAVLASLIVPPVLAPQDGVELGIPLVAAIVGAVVAWRTRSPSWTILGGLAAFWLLQAIGGR